MSAEHLVHGPLTSRVEPRADEVVGRPESLLVRLFRRVDDNLAEI